METFREVFDNFIKEKTQDDVLIISDLCVKTGVDPNMWLKYYIKRESGSQTGTDFLDDMLSLFIFYLHNEFVKCLMKYIEPVGKNIYGEPYIHVDFEVVYKYNIGLSIKHGKTFKDLPLKILQKQELMKNKLFSFIVNETKLEIYNKNDIRYLKLLSLKK